MSSKVIVRLADRMLYLTLQTTGCIEDASGDSNLNLGVENSGGRESMDVWRTGGSGAGVGG